MSLRGLCYAARDKIREKFPLEAVLCDVMPDGQPPFMTGDHFVAVWASQWTPGDGIDLGIDELLGFTCTITFATGVSPPDRTAPELIYKACNGIEQWARRILHILVKYQYEVMCEANAYAEQEACGCDPEIPTYLIQAPYRWSGSDPSPRFVGPDWLSADPDDEEGLYGMTMDVRFSDAERMAPNNGIPA